MGFSLRFIIIDWFTAWHRLGFDLNRWRVGDRRLLILQIVLPEASFGSELLLRRIEARCRITPFVVERRPMS